MMIVVCELFVESFWICLGMYIIVVGVDVFGKYEFVFVLFDNV